MIQFAKDHYFEADCPNCEQAEIRLRYTWPAVVAPEIVEQPCNCLIGDDWAEEALEKHLDYEAWASARRWPDPRWDGD